MLDRASAADDFRESDHPRASNGQFGTGSAVHVVTTHDGETGETEINHVGTDKAAAAEAHGEAKDENEDAGVTELHAPKVSGKRGQRSDTVHIVHAPDGAGGVDVHGVHLDYGAARGQAVVLSQDAWEEAGADRSELDRNELEEDDAAESWNEEHADEPGALLIKVDVDGVVDRDESGAMQWVQDGEDVEPDDDTLAEFDEHFDGLYPPDERAVYPGLEGANDHFEAEGRHEAIFRIHTHKAGVFAKDKAMKPRKDVIALDRASVRRVDADGHLHVERTPISKASVNGYVGREIPGYQALGLKADRIYRMWRHPDELAKAVDSAAGKPLFMGHRAVGAADHDHENNVGSVTAPKWEPPFVTAALDVWPQTAIDAIESREHAELSSAYRYRPDMTPGTTPDGERYDGVMRDIDFSHVALVPEGRAGKDVRVLDAAPRRLKDLYMIANAAHPARQAAKADAALFGATLASLGAMLRPKLAEDAKLDLMPALKGVTARTAKAKAPAIARAVVKAAKGKLAADADLEPAEVQAVVEEVADLIKSESDDIAAAVADPDPAVAPGAAGEDAPDMDALMQYLGGVLTDEQMAKVKAMMGKGDADAEDARRRRGAAASAPSAQDDKDKIVMTPAAMDAKLAQVRKDAAADAMAAASAIRDAERFVRPYVGEIVIACDSAEAVHRAALDVLKVKHEGKHPDALADLVEVHGKAALAAKEPRHRSMASDAAPAGAVAYDAKTFPNSGRLK